MLSILLSSDSEVTEKSIQLFAFRAECCQERQVDVAMDISYIEIENLN